MAKTDRYVMTLNEELWQLPYPQPGDVIELVCVAVNRDTEEAIIKYRVKGPPLPSTLTASSASPSPQTASGSRGSQAHNPR